MTRFVISLTAIFAFTGCGGSPEAGTAPPKQASNSVPTPLVVKDETPPETKAAKASPPTTPKKSADAPGLVLPEDDADLVGGKGPELPIR